MCKCVIVRVVCLQSFIYSFCIYYAQPQLQFSLTLLNTQLPTTRMNRNVQKNEIVSVNMSITSSFSFFCFANTIRKKISKENGKNNKNVCLLLWLILFYYCFIFFFFFGSLLLEEGKLALFFLIRFSLFNF